MAQSTHVSKDPRVLWFNGGISHDWVRVASHEDFEALVHEYNLRVKYSPVSLGDGRGFEFAIR